MTKLELITMARLFVLVFNQILIKKEGSEAWLESWMQCYRMDVWRYMMRRLKCIFKKDQCLIYD